MKHLTIGHSVNAVPACLLARVRFAVRVLRSAAKRSRRTCTLRRRSASLTSSVVSVPRLACRMNLAASWDRGTGSSACRLAATGATLLGGVACARLHNLPQPHINMWRERLGRVVAQACDCHALSNHVNGLRLHGVHGLQAAAACSEFQANAQCMSCCKCPYERSEGVQSPDALHRS